MLEVLISDIMLYSQLAQKLLEIAPRENGFHDDFHGLQFGSNLNSEDFHIHKVVVCLDPSKQNILEAIKHKANIIISHHGITHHPLLNWNDSVLDQIKLLAMNNIRLYVMHTPWDAAPEGITESFMKLAGFNLDKVFFMGDRGQKKPIGRIGSPYRPNLSLKEVIEGLKRHLHIQYVRFVGSIDSIITKAVFVGGKGFKSDMISDILNQGCNTFITGEATYAEHLAAKELKLNLIEVGHYASEKIGMEQLQRILSLTFPRDEIVYVDSGDPANFI